MVGDVVENLMVSTALETHPSALLGVDPFDFCSSRPCSTEHSRGEATLIERVAEFFEDYRQEPAGKY